MPARAHESVRGGGVHLFLYVCPAFWKYLLLELQRLRQTYRVYTHTHTDRLTVPTHTHTCTQTQKCIDFLLTALHSRSLIGKPSQDYFFVYVREGRMGTLNI